MTMIYDLPDNKILINYIRQEIHKQGGSLSFASFMNFALYHPSFGYYNRPECLFGEQGDFTTSPEISPLFAYCFAKQIQPFTPYFASHQILELGAGSGQLAGDLLLALAKLNCLPHYYYIYEVSAALKKQQQIFLQAYCPQFFSRIIWLNELPNHFEGIIIANEVLDAIPVHCFYVENDKVYEKQVGWENNQFIWKLSSDYSDPSLHEANAIKNLYHLPNGYSSEINLMSARFVQRLAKNLTKGVIFFADYGYGQSEYYHSQRQKGTLTCFYKHKKHDNPFIGVGLQDISAHVDFTRVVEMAADNDLSLAGFTSQAAFLLGCGLLEIAAKQEINCSEIEKFKLHQGIKLLTFPTEMGETIKIMCLTKNIDLNQNTLIGFELLDKRRDL